MQQGSLLISAAFVWGRAADHRRAIMPQLAPFTAATDGRFPPSLETLVGSRREAKNGS